MFLPACISLDLHHNSLRISIFLLIFLVASLILQSFYYSCLVYKVHKTTKNALIFHLLQNDNLESFVARNQAVYYLISLVNFLFHQLQCIPVDDLCEYLTFFLIILVKSVQIVSAAPVVITCFIIFGCQSSNLLLYPFNSSFVALSKIQVNHSKYRLYALFLLLRLC